MTSEAQPLTGAFFFFIMNCIMNKGGNDHAHTIGQRVIHRKSPSLCNNLVLRHENELRISEYQSQDHQEMHWSMDKSPGTAGAHRTDGLYAEGCSALNSCRLS